MKRLAREYGFPNGVLFGVYTALLFLAFWRIQVPDRNTMGWRCIMMTFERGMTW